MRIYIMKWVDTDSIESLRYYKTLKLNYSMISESQDARCIMTWLNADAYSN